MGTQTVIYPYESTLLSSKKELTNDMQQHEIISHWVKQARQKSDYYMIPFI